MSSRPTRDDASLARQLRALADVEANIETPPHVEAAVMAGWDAAHAPRTRSRVRTLVRGAATVAAGVTVAGAFALQHSVGAPAPPLPGTPDASWAASTVVPTPVVPPERIDAAPAPLAEPSVLLLVGEPLAEGEPVRVVRMRVASSTLAAFGIRSLGPQPPESLDLDVLVGEDGVARALKVGL